MKKKTTNRIDSRFVKQKTDVELNFQDKYKLKLQIIIEIKGKFKPRQVMQ